MARPKIEYKAKRNGNSLQFFIGDEYCGSISIKYLCELAKVQNRKSTIPD